MLRPSDYIIYIKLNNQEDRYLLVHGYTGAVDVVNKAVSDTLQLAKDDPKHLNAFKPEHLETLKKRGYITKMSSQQEQETMKIIVEKVADEYRKNDDTRAFILIPTYNCNFRCPYCFQKRLQKNGKEWLLKTMSFEMIDSIFNQIKIYQEEGKSVNLMLYGGEPLLKENYKLIEYIFSKARERKLPLSIISNGYELEFFENLLDQEYISSIQITLDGDEETHNQRRYLAGGKPTFAKIIENISLCLKKGVRVVVRSNIAEDNIQKNEYLLNLFQERGWVQNENFSSYVSPMLLTPDNTTVSDITKEILLEHENSWNSAIVSSFTKTFKEKKLAEFSIHKCGSGGSNLIIDPQNNIYPCLNSVDEHEDIIGHVDIDNKILVFNDNYNYWANRTVKNIEECIKCPFALFCAGGCMSNAKMVHGDIYKPFCYFFKDMFPKVVADTYSKVFS